MDTQVEKAIDAGLEVFTGKYDLDDEVVNDLRAMLHVAVKANVKPRPPAAGGGSKGDKRPRRKTGYNLYIRSKFEEAKKNQPEGGEEATKPNSQEQMATFSKEWKNLSEEQKQPYIDQAEAINTENGTQSGGGKKGGNKRNLSGYNLFYREELDNIRNSKDKDKSLMVAVGAAWKDLSAEEQDEYKKRAAELSANKDN